MLQKEYMQEGCKLSETTNHEIQVRLPFKMLAAILNQLDEMELHAIQRYVNVVLI